MAFASLAAADVTSRSVFPSEVGVPTAGGASSNTPEPEGIPEHILLGVNRSGQPVYWRFRDGVNRHLIIFGSSGNGKTYSIQCLLAELARKQLNTMVLDYSQSFTSSEILPPVKPYFPEDEQHIVVAKPLPINPLTRQTLTQLHTDEPPYLVAGRVTDIFKKIFNLGTQQVNILQDAVIECLEKYPQTTFQHVEKMLEDFRDDDRHNKNSLETLQSHIRSFLRTKPFTEPRDDVGWEKLYNMLPACNHVFQLASIPDVFAAGIIEFVLWDLFFHAQRCGNPEHPSIVVLDEIQNLSLQSGSPVDKILREGRKFGMGLIAATQSFSGVKQSLSTLNQAACKLYFRPADNEMAECGKLLHDLDSSFSASEWKEFYVKTFGPDFMDNQSDPKMWEKIYDVDDEIIWDIRQTLKNKFVKFVKDDFRETWLKNQGDPSRIVSVLEKINPNALLIGFARRFATYKRAHLLFTDLDRLSKIVNNPNYPVQFIFSGKAHPADGAGQGLIKRIVEISRMPEFLGKIIFLENYDMKVAKRLISGVDIWLNTPTRPLEASGTSGEKAEMNGVLNFSVLDGWWYEGYKEGAGWALTDKRTFQDQSQQDKLDAATIYSMLENQIVPLYFAKNSKGYSPEWIQYIKNSIAKIAPHFTMERMLHDYIDRFYLKEGKRTHLLKADNYAKAKEIAAWKEEFVSKWNDIEICSVSIPDGLLYNPHVGEEYEMTVVLDNKGLGNCLGVELVIANVEEGNTEPYKTLEMKPVKTEGTKVTYKLRYLLNDSGVFRYSFRMFPQNPDLPHRQDLAYVRWF